LIPAPGIPASSTAKETEMKIGPVILVAVLFSASAMQASFAEDAASTAGHPEGSTPSAEPSGSSPATSDAGGLVERAKPDNHAPAENAARPKSEGNTGAQEGHSTSDEQNLKASVDGGPKGRGVKTPSGDAGAIDTRITAPSRYSRNTPGKAAKSSFKIVAPGNIHARRLPAPGTVNPNARNAIGLAVTRQEGIQERSGEPHGVPVQSPAVSGPGNLAKPDGGLERPQIVRPSPSPIVSAPVAKRGTINGTGLTHPSSAPSGLGGPAKAVVGINATTIRPKHP
jgi:hypothetical protein